MNWPTLLGLGFAVIACGGDKPIDLPPDASLPSDAPLLPEGHALLAVLAESQLDFTEDALFCRYIGDTLDPRAPGSLCPASRADFDAAPHGAQNFGWAIRLVFSRPLDPSRLAGAPPVVLRCGPAGFEATLAFASSYDPNGSSLHVLPDLFATSFPAGTPCRLSINDNVVDLDGVPPDLVDVPFELANLALVEVTPTAGGIIRPTGAAEFRFNASLEEASLDALVDAELTTAAGAAVPYSAEVDDIDASRDGIYIFPTVTWRPGDYIARLRAGASVAELNGATITFPVEVATTLTVSFARIGTAPASGGILPTTGGAITIFLNDSLAPASVTPDKLEMIDPSNNPVPFVVTIVTNEVSDDAIRITPTAALIPTSGAERYKLRVKPTAVITSVGGFVLGPISLVYRVVPPPP